MAKKKYVRLNIKEREILFKGLAEGRSQKSIAEELERHPSTISREIRRIEMNRFSYRPSDGQKDADQQSAKRKRTYKLLINKELVEFVEEKLRFKWSPEQICGILKKDFPEKEHGFFLPTRLSCFYLRDSLFFSIQPQQTQAVLPGKMNPWQSLKQSTARYLIVKAPDYRVPGESFWAQHL